MDMKPAETCIDCGRPLKGRRIHWLNFDATTHQPIAPDAEPAHGDWGFHPIGMDCFAKRKLPAGWLRTHDRYYDDARAAGTPTN